MPEPHWRTQESFFKPELIETLLDMTIGRKGQLIEARHVRYCWESLVDGGQGCLGGYFSEH